MCNATASLVLTAIRDLEHDSKQSFVKSADVLRVAIDRAGFLTAARREALYTEVNPPRDEVLTNFHAVLVALVHEADHAKRLVRGQGYFGEPDGSQSPANPLFTYCELTDAGRAFIAAAPPEPVN
jgi:hypothetical protein